MVKILVGTNCSPFVKLPEILTFYIIFVSVIEIGVNTKSKVTQTCEVAQQLPANFLIS